jgi:hypothetical protein
MGFIGLLATALQALFSAGIKVWEDWHAKSGVTPEQLTTDAQNIAMGVSSVVGDVEGIYQESKKQLLELHPDLPTMHARVVTAAASEHAAAQLAAAPAPAPATEKAKA